MFVRGEEYRRKQLQKKYGCQQEGGISTPKGQPFSFIFTGESGKRHGYDHQGMIRYRARAVLLLSLLLNLTACSTWQSIGPITPSQFIEAEQPDRVRVTGAHVSDLELVSPSVEGDQLVGADNFSVPLEDILRLEVQRFSLQPTLVAVSWVGVYAGVFLVLSLIEEVKY